MSTTKVDEDNGKQNNKKKQRCEEVLSDKEKSLSKDEKKVKRKIYEKNILNEEFDPGSG